MPAVHRWEEGRVGTMLRDAVAEDSTDQECGGRDGRTFGHAPKRPGRREPTVGNLKGILGLNGPTRDGHRPEEGLEDAPP